MSYLAFWKVVATCQRRWNRLPNHHIATTDARVKIFRKETTTTRSLFLTRHYAILLSVCYQNYKASQGFSQALKVFPT